MHFSLPTLLTAILAAAGARAFIAWSDFDCYGVPSPSVACDGECHVFEGNHSFNADRVFFDPTTRCVSVYLDTACETLEKQFPDQTGGCTNAITGTALRSYRCGRLNQCFP